MSKMTQLLGQFEVEAKKAGDAPMVGKLIAPPLRLLVVWMKTITERQENILERLEAMEAHE